jgi:hypothetical protein
MRKASTISLTPRITAKAATHATRSFDYTTVSAIAILFGIVAIAAECELDDASDHGRSVNRVRAVALQWWMGRAGIEPATLGLKVDAAGLRALA